jgi:hypothetical protein
VKIDLSGLTETEKWNFWYDRGLASAEEMYAATGELPASGDYAVSDLDQDTIAAYRAAR